jgi:D-alanine-D-alanine ligase-like ATP-grasp enzyme
MCRLLVVASNFDLEGAGPVAVLEDQIAFVRGLGVDAELLVDPSQVELELALLSNRFDCSFSPISRCYRRRADGQIVPRDYDIYAIFERLDHSFIGTTYFRSMLVDDKTLANGRYGLAPPGLLITRVLFEQEPAVACQRLGSLSYPVIVKPNALGGSTGVDSGAVVLDADAAMERIRVIFSRLAPVSELRVEKYIGGAREFTVAVLGNGAAVATSVTEVIKPEESASVFSEHEKRTRFEDRKVRYQTIADGVLRGALAALAHETFQRFALRDLARFDILLKDRFYVTDINVPPILSDSFAHEWQQFYGTKKQQLLTFALAAYHYRLLSESRLSSVPFAVLEQVPRVIRHALCPLSSI